MLNTVCVLCVIASEAIFFTGIRLLRLINKHAVGLAMTDAKIIAHSVNVKVL